MFHRHRFEFRSLKEMVTAFGKGDVTLVLYVCEVCDKPKTETITGHWTKEELGLA